MEPASTRVRCVMSQGPAHLNRCVLRAGPLPTAAALSDALKSANQDVEAALHQDRTLERQRDCQGVLGVFQARLQRACAARCPA
jgi:hypothetical protein